MAVPDSKLPVPDAVMATVRRAKRIVCIGHVTPDADCLGAILACSRAWLRAGIADVSASLPEKTLSRRLRFLKELADVRLATSEDFAAASTLVVFDTAKLPRCNLVSGLEPDWHEGRTVINIDHHATNTQFGTINWVMPEASSTCEMVARLMFAESVALDEVSATLLYAGLFADTAGFSLATTTAGAHRAAADLIDAGADAALVGERMFRSISVNEFRLLQRIYANTHITAGGRIAYSTASFADIQETGCSARDIDDQVIVPRSLADIDLAILMTEGHPGQVRLNIRGENGLDVLGLARQFAGGGHRSAAGAVLYCGLDEAIDKVLGAAVAFLDQPPPPDAASNQPERFVQQDCQVRQEIHDD